ncbi:HIT family protein [Propionicicella superfundia]|uniref:HIT family protein n=1 Tax=Propionicicella superfundia TaxID=348582 RepID=UPI000491A04D|nr:HIT domain-containing protein [Propionicicella superfundia]
MDCLFCKIVSGDIGSRQVYADDVAIAFLDIAPWHPGHTLVIPRRHVSDLTAPDALSEIAASVEATAALLRERLRPDGMNLLVNQGAVAGQEVFHFHVHLVPRYERNPGMRNLMTKEPGIDVDEVHRRITG